MFFFYTPIYVTLYSNNVNIMFVSCREWTNHVTIVMESCNRLYLIPKLSKIIVRTNQFVISYGYFDFFEFHEIVKSETSAKHEETSSHNQ